MKSDYEGQWRNKMKVAGGILGIALVLSCGSSRVIAQTSAATPKADAAKAESAPTCYRLTYTITELDGAKRIGTQHFAMTVDPSSGESQLKLGSKVPIVTESSNPQSLAPSQVQYQDIGLHISARLHEYATGEEVYSRVEQTSLSEEQSTVGRNDPVIRQATLQSTALLTLGKPVMLGSLDVPGSTRHLDIEVVLEVVR
jgi:hypothetical protein